MPLVSACAEHSVPRLKDQPQPERGAVPVSSGLPTGELVDTIDRLEAAPFVGMKKQDLQASLWSRRWQNKLSRGHESTALRVDILCRAVRRVVNQHPGVFRL